MPGEALDEHGQEGQLPLLLGLLKHEGYEVEYGCSEEGRLAVLVVSDGELRDGQKI